MTIGAEELLKKYRWDRVEVAIALLEGKLDICEQQYVGELLDVSIRWAAEIRYKEKQKVVDIGKPI